MIQSRSDFRGTSQGCLLLHIEHESHAWTLFLMHSRQACKISCMNAKHSAKHVFMFWYTPSNSQSWQPQLLMMSKAWWSKVRYTFSNNTWCDRRSLCGFPLPQSTVTEIELNQFYENIANIQHKWVAKPCDFSVKMYHKTGWRGTIFTYFIS